MPPDDRSLKLCWSCVLEGAVPLPASLLEDDDEEDGVGQAELLSPIAASTTSQSSRRSNTGGSDGGGDGGGGHAERQPGGKKGEGGGGGGFLSALVSLIEGVASPTSPVRPRRGGAAGGAGKRPDAKRPPPLSIPNPKGVMGDESGESAGGGRATTLSPSSAAGAGAGAADGAAVRTHSRGDSSPLVLRKEYDPEPGSRGQPLEEKDIKGCASPSTAGSLTESGDDLLRGGGGENGGASGGTANAGLVDSDVGVFLDEKPVELGFPSERPWAHGFGV